MKSMSAINATHNIKMLAPAPAGNAPVKTCICKPNDVCPLNGECLTECFVYKASVIAPNIPTRVYYGATEGRFKEWYNNHTKSFRHESYSRDTELSKYLWELKHAGLDETIR